MKTTNIASPAALTSATKSAEFIELVSMPPLVRARLAKSKKAASTHRTTASQTPQGGETWADIELTTTGSPADPLSAQINRQQRGINVVVHEARLAPVIDFPATPRREAKKLRASEAKAVRAVKAVAKQDNERVKASLPTSDLEGATAKATPDAVTTILRQRKQKTRPAQARTTRGGGSNFQHDLDRIGGKNEWITPPHVIRALGLPKFDLDPCGPTLKKRLLMPAELRIAKTCFSIEDDGLSRPWVGRVFCNPPYGLIARPWLAKCAQHGNCIALVYGRTETVAFQQSVWGHASAILFLFGRLRFFHVDGREGGSAGAPSVLIAYGANNARLLKKCSLRGEFVRLRKPRRLNHSVAALATAQRPGLKAAKGTTPSP